MTEPQATYSISVRLRRTTTEEGFVSVPVTDAVMADGTADDGTFRLDGAKVFAEAVRLGAELDTWTVEESAIEVHPIQRPPAGIG